MDACAFRWRRNAVPRIAGQCKASQIKATRIGAWQQALFWAALARRQGPALQCGASHCIAVHGMSKQRGLELGNRLFSGPLWSECTALHCIARQRSDMHGTEPKCKAKHGISKQRGSGFGNRPFSGPLWPECSAKHRSVWKGIALHGKAIQSNADCLLATAGFPGRFGSPGRVSSAALSTD